MAVCFATSVSAQSVGFEVKGSVFEKSTGEPVIGAGIRLLNKADSVYIKGISTGTDGRFTLSGIKTGKYIVHVGFMGFQPFYRDVEVTDKSVNIGRIELSEAVTALNVVEVTAQANPMTVKQDTIQFNAGAFRVRQGANLEELLRRIPGMEIDEDGKITYNGEAIERIELDGRNFFGNDPQMATRNLPSDIIKNLQVVDKKSEEARLTGMSDGEKVKVLNLEIKEDKKKGLIANLTGGYGTKDRYNTNLMTNFFNGDARYTILGELNNIDGVRRGRGEQVTRRIGGNYDSAFKNKTILLTAEAFYTNRAFMTNGQNLSEELLGGERRNYGSETYSNERHQDNVYANARLEWKPSEATMLVYEPTFRYSKSSSDQSSNFSTVNGERQKINEGFSSVLDQSSGYNINGQLHFRHTFNEEGRNLYTRWTYDYNNSKGDGTNLSETRFFQTGKSQNRDQYNDNRDEGFGTRLRVAYLEPFSKKWALQLTYDINYEKRDNDRAAFNKDESGEYTILDPVYSRGSSNTSLTHRAMARMRYSFGSKSNLYFGMSANPSTTHTVTTQGGEVNFDKSRTVWNYAPSAILEYRPTDSLSLNVRYSGRTRQPGMSQLNPATIILSPLAQVQGNPDLLPSFNHNVWSSLYINRRASRQSFNLMGGWSYATNAVASKQLIDVNTGARTTTYENIDGNQSVFAGFMINTPIGGAKSKWNSFTFGRINYSSEKGFVNQELNKADVWRVRGAQRITWSGSWLQATLGGFAMLQNVHNSISTDLNRLTWDYNGYGEAIVTLPWDLSITSRLTYQDAVGYDDGLKRDFWLLDASINWSFLKGKNATLELSGYDLLQQRTSFRRQVTANRIEDMQVNGITSYVMLSFTYRFNNMGGGVTAPPSGRRGYGYGRGRRPH